MPKQKTTMKKVALATLVEDFSLYPRNKVNDSHIGDLVRSVQGGAKLPPIVVDAASLRIVDGVHRRRAWLRVLGEEAAATVELRHYANDAELFLDAVALNSVHGQKLDRHDQTRIVLKLREFQISDEMIAVNLHVPVQEVETLSVRVVFSNEGEAVPMKRGLEHLRGQKFTRAQLEAAGSVRSAEAGRLALELSRLLKNDLVNLEDEQIVVRLRELADALDEALKAVPA